MIENLIHSIQQLYPDCPITKSHSVCCINESNEKASVRQLSFDIQESVVVDTTFVKSLSRFFQSNKSDEVFGKECDGIILFEHNDKNYCFLVELKSAFDTKEIDKAQKQILSTHVKLNMALGLLADYSKSDFEFIGIIASQKPTDNRLRWIESMNRLPDDDPAKKPHLFPIKLFFENYLEEKSYRLNPNCMYEKMKYCHVTVPPDSSIYKADIAKFL